MWRKHKKELFGCMIVSIAIVLLLLAIVTVFEIYDIHVSGSREMWIGLIGAIIGGAFTLFGVLLTVFHQEEQNKEDKRLEYMPLLGFEVVELDRYGKRSSFDEPPYDGTLSCEKEELCTSAFLFRENKLCKTIVISVLNDTCVFDFTIDGCLINGKGMRKGQAFNPALRRIASGEVFGLIFNCDDDSGEQIFCLIRFTYKDIFGYNYYQDLPFEYVEINRGGMIEQHIEIRDIKAPLLITSTTKSLEETVKEYCDYETFCLK